MLELYSFVDYFTIPPSFVSIYVDRTWIGKCKTDFFSMKTPFFFSLEKKRVRIIDEQEKKSIELALGQE